MKIKGNMGKATKFTADLFPKPTPENLNKYIGASKGTASTTTTAKPTTTTSSGSSGSDLRS